MRMFLVLGFLAAKAWGCSCGVSPTGTPPCQSAWLYDAVFTGMVTEITDPVQPIAQVKTETSQPSFPQRKVRIKISEVLVGLDPNQQEIVIETGLGGGDCGYGFHRNLDYIVYASKKRGGGFSTGICSPSRPVENAAEDLKYLRQLAHSSPVAEIGVTAYDVHGIRGYRVGGPPQLPVLEGARVTIDGPGVHESSTTDANGRHIFAGLPPGLYKVDVTLEGYALPGQLPPVKVSPKGCAEVPLPLQLDRSVSGHVLTRDGLPASGVTIEAVPTLPRHNNDLPTAADSSAADANGRYELRHLTTGDYYLGISLSRSPTLQNPYTRWFYPGAEDPARAAILHVSDGPETQRLDLTLPDAQHDRVIQGAVFWPDGRPAEGVNMFLEDPRWSWQVFSVAATTDKQGHFTAHALDGTRYRLHGVRSASGTISAEPVQIDPGANPLNIKLVLLLKTDSRRDGVSKGLEDWRKGLGLR
jgi:hypothetical protein